MTSTKLVVRVLDAAGRLLAWTEVRAAVRGDGCLWADGVYLAGVEVAGLPATLSVHWADVNVEVRVPYSPGPVSVGAILQLSWQGPIMVVGKPAQGLPGVTVGNSPKVSIPTGALGAQGN